MSRKILIVEDSCDLREMLGSVLAAYGWNPLLAESGRKALDKLAPPSHPKGASVGSR